MRLHFGRLVPAVWQVNSLSDPGVGEWIDKGIPASASMDLLRLLLLSIRPIYRISLIDKVKGWLRILSAIPQLPFLSA